jgi:hypothetical protein
MTVTLRRHRVDLVLPIMPRKFRRGDKRNYLRWHCWVEAVRELAAHYKGTTTAPRRGRGRRA